jgi:hypothetical protein
VKRDVLKKKARCGKENLLLLHGGSSSLLELGTLGLLLVDTLGKELSILGLWYC